MAPRLLDGVVAETDQRDARIVALETENRQLKRQAGDAELAAERAKEDANRALGMLRQQLSPLYRALQAVFGELDAAGVVDAPAASAAPSSGSAVDANTKAVWDGWKTRMPGAPSKVIDALLLHRTLTMTALTVAAGIHYNTARDAVLRLNKAGLITKSGGAISLKSLTS